MSETHFGFTSVDEQSKAERVRGVFDSVAPKYDVMNDLMSLGLHRLWKAYTVGVARVRPGDVILDIAGGTGDLARAFDAIAWDSEQLERQVSWTAPKQPGLVRFWLVLRDFRGGSAFSERAVCVQ